MSGTADFWTWGSCSFVFWKSMRKKNVGDLIGNIYFVEISLGLKCSSRFNCNPFGGLYSTSQPKYTDITSHFLPWPCTALCSVLFAECVMHLNELKHCSSIHMSQQKKKSNCSPEIQLLHRTHFPHREVNLVDGSTISKWELISYLN